jgi:hypothetical protein
MQDQSRRHDEDRHAATSADSDSVRGGRAGEKLYSAARYVVASFALWASFWFLLAALAMYVECLGAAVFQNLFTWETVPTIGLGPWGGILLFGAATTVAWGLRMLGGRLSVPTRIRPDDTLNLDRVRAVYLRSFDSDGVDTSGSVATGFGFRRDAELIAQFGPLGDVAIVSKPRQLATNIGGTPVSLVGDWHETIADLMKRARFVIVRIGFTKGLDWECERAKSLPPTKLVVLTDEWFGEHERDDLRRCYYLARCTEWLPLVVAGIAFATYFGLREGLVPAIEGAARVVAVFAIGIGTTIAMGLAPASDMIFWRTRDGAEKWLRNSFDWKLKQPGRIVVCAKDRSPSTLPDVSRLPVARVLDWIVWLMSMPFGRKVAHPPKAPEWQGELASLRSHIGVHAARGRLFAKAATHVAAAAVGFAILRSVAPLVR